MWHPVCEKYPVQASSLEKKKPVNWHLLFCKLAICFIPALLILFAAIENWSSLILCGVICIFVACEIRKEDAK